MGRNYYTGGGSLLNADMGFRTFDPAQEQKMILLRAERAHGPVRPSNEYGLQVQQQLLILLTHIASGKKRPHVPTLFREEVDGFNSLIDWANSKTEFAEIKKRFDGRANQPSRLFSGKRRNKSFSDAKEKGVQQTEATFESTASAGAVTPHTRCLASKPKPTVPTTAPSDKPTEIALAAEKLGISVAELQRRVIALKRQHGT